MSRKTAADLYAEEFEDGPLRRLGRQIVKQRAIIKKLREQSLSSAVSSEVASLRTRLLAQAAVTERMREAIRKAKSPYAHNTLSTTGFGKCRMECLSCGWHYERNALLATPFTPSESEVRAMEKVEVALRECVRDLKQGIRDGEVDGDNFGYHQGVEALSSLDAIRREAGK